MTVLRYRDGPQARNRSCGEVKYSHSKTAPEHPIQQARADLGGTRGPCPPRYQTLCNITLKQHNAGVHCNKNAISGMKLCLSFSPGLKFQAVYL